MIKFNNNKNNNYLSKIHKNSNKYFKNKNTFLKLVIRIQCFWI